MESSGKMMASLIYNNNNTNNNLNWNGLINNSNSVNNDKRISSEINNYCNLINQNQSQNMVTTASSSCYEMDIPIVLKNNYSPEKYPILTFDHLKETIPIFYDFTAHQDEKAAPSNNNGFIQAASNAKPIEHFNVIKTNGNRNKSPMNGLKKLLPIAKQTSTITQQQQPIVTSTSVMATAPSYSMIKTKNLNYVNHKFIISDSENISVKKMITVKQPKIVNPTQQPQSLLKNSYSASGSGGGCGGGGNSKENLNGKTTVTCNKVEIANCTKFYYASNNCMKPIVSPNIISSGIYRSTGQLNGVKRKLAAVVEPVKNNILIMNCAKGKVVPIAKLDEEISSIQNSTGTNYSHSDSQKNSSNLVVNIVNMVADKPEITQRAEIVGIVPATQTEIVKIENPATTSSTTGNISVLTEPKSRIYHNHDTNKKIIYRIVNPEDVNLIKTEAPTALNALDRVKVKKYKSPGRPKKVTKNKKWVDIRHPVKKPVVQTQPTARTRAGRLSRPPKHVQNYFRGNSKLIEPAVIPKEEQHETILAAEHVNFVKRERKIPSQYKCKKCNKIYLGDNRMFRHLEAHPDHGDQSELFKMKINKNYYDDSIYQYFIKKLILKSNLDNRSKLLIDEIRNFNKKIKFLLKKLLIIDNNTDETEFIDHDLLKFIDYPLNRNYSVDHTLLENIDCIDENNEVIDIIDAITPPVIDEQQTLQQQHHHHNHDDAQQNDHHQIDYSNLNISLDSNDGDKTNLSYDSLLQSVDEFVKERWKKFISEEGDFIAVVDSQLPDIKVEDTHHDHHNHDVPHPPPILDLSLDYLLN